MEATNAGLSPGPAKKKPVAPRMYRSECGTINMPTEMITTKEKFVKIWKGKVKGKDINILWQEAEKFKKQFS